MENYRKQIIKEKKTCNCKPEWQIILDHLVYQDQILLFRICRKMIIYLNRINVPEIQDIMEGLNPTLNTQDNIQSYGPNWPKPKGAPFVADIMFDKIFGIADIYISDNDISRLLRQWIHQEHLGVLSRVLEKKDAPFNEIQEAVKKYLKLFGPKNYQSIDEIVGLRVGLISRFLSENLRYINIAKRHLRIKVMDEILNRTIGPAAGYGKLGGKSAGLILARQILLDKKKYNPLLEKVATPKSRFITSDNLSDFLHYNALEEFIYTKYQDAEDIKNEAAFVEYIFKNSVFPPEAISAFKMILDDFDGKPIIVRSSSLLEDSFDASFSGKYKSLFLSNIGTKEERLTALVNAISEVYASTFGPDPIEYRHERGLIDFREEMGILVQQVVGRKVGKYYLPTHAGVAFSNNEMRWSTRIKREDGIIRLVAGLGTRAVDRTIDDYPLLVSPGKPNIKANTSYEHTVMYSQKYVDVINLETNNFETIEFSELVKEAKGQIPGIGKIVSFDRGGIIVDPITNLADYEKEDLVVTFNNLIGKTNFITQMKEMLRELSDAIGGPVDIEFAHDGERLYLLQCRPQSQSTYTRVEKLPAGYKDRDVIFSANEFVNSGYVPEIQYLVYVDPIEYSKLPSAEDMKEVGAIVSRLNTNLPKRKFVLMGPGRWGSKGDIKLGVPIIYSDINNTSMLIEIGRESKGYVPELSFGTHFFQDLVEADIKYLPLYPDKNGNKFDYDFFQNTENSLHKFVPGKESFDKVVRVIDTDDVKIGKVVNVYMDGDKGEALAILV